MAAADAVTAELEALVPGFKAVFGGEELKRACATLAGALIGGSLPPPLDTLASDPDLHVRELALAARQYAAASAAGAPTDHDTLYHHGLVLQELAGRLQQGSADQAAMLRQACGRYEAALTLRPGSHATLYNWGVALSDLARALKPGSPGEAAAALHLASQKYAASLQLHPRNPQALNNWGLVLQELSADTRDWAERDTLVRGAVGKFRLALRCRPDFDRGCYNLGTVFYTAAVALQSDTDSPLPRGAREAAARAALAGAAQYICLAHALSPGKEVYRKSLAVVRTMLPLPFLRAGYLTAPRARSLGGVTETHRREWFVLDHVSLRRASSVEASLSTAGAGVLPGGQRGTTAAAATVQPDDEPLEVPLEEMLAVRRCCEPSLPEGGAIWISTQTYPTGMYLVADDTDAADAWVDALSLCQHLVRTRCSAALEEALAPAPARRGKHGR